MGEPTAPRRPMAWQNTLGEMKTHGTRLAQTASCAFPDRWIDLDVDALIAKWGAAWVTGIARRPATSAARRATIWPLRVPRHRTAR